MLTYTLIEEETLPRPRKSLSQNFLRPSVCERVVQFAQIEEGDRVIEIGPGTGNLTEALLNSGALVTGIEYDQRLAKHLERVRFRYSVPMPFALAGIRF